VKCTHGATIGRLDETSLFYLRTRGIGRDDARDILIHAFAGDVLERFRSRTCDAGLRRRSTNGSTGTRRERGCERRPRRPAPASFDVARIRRDFPILSAPCAAPARLPGQRQLHTEAAAVLDAERRFYTEHYANIHRGVYQLSQEATEAYDKARERVSRFLNASSPREIVFVRGTTEAINLVASSWGRMSLRPGDEVLISGMEHHSGIVPWQMACAASGAHLRVIPVTDAGELDLGAAERLMTERTKILSVIHVSNALGTVNPAKALIALAKARGIPVLLDGAQTISHMPVDVRDLDCDFFVFSGHKLFGPTGIGVLWAREAILDAMPPYHGGGNMIHQVTFEKTTYAALPFKFEAGTTNIAGTLGLAAAVDYVASIGYDAIAAYERGLLAYLLEGSRRCRKCTCSVLPKSASACFR
jgi:cysteine desulfurase/selenocysteine lyase